MRRFAIPLLIILLLIAAVLLVTNSKKPSVTPGVTPETANDFPITISDALNNKVTVATRPMRIISLAPSVTEVIYAVGAGDRLIADTTYCDYPVAAQKLPKIGGFIDPNVEQIVALKPDLVIGAKGNPREALGQLRQMNIPVVTIDPETLDSAIDESLRIVGKVTGLSKKADKLASDNSKRKEVVAQQAAARAKRPRILMLFTADSLFSVGPGSYLDEMITLAGGVNIAGDTRLAWPELSMEKVIKDDPQIILIISMEKGATSSFSDEILQQLRAKKQWKNISAVRNGKVVYLGNDELTLPGPRLINGLEAMAQVISPTPVNENKP